MDSYSNETWIFIASVVALLTFSMVVIILISLRNYYSYPINHISPETQIV